MKAFRTELDEIVSIVFADTASKARNATRTAALDAYYTNVDYADIKVLRAKDYDEALTRNRKCPTINHCYNMEYLVRGKI